MDLHRELMHQPVISVSSRTSRSATLKSWFAFACWNADCRFWPIMTNVDRKIASSETMNVNVGQGLFSNNSIYTANSSTCR